MEKWGKRWGAIGDEFFFFPFLSLNLGEKNGGMEEWGEKWGAIGDEIFFLIFVTKFREENEIIEKWRKK